MRVHGEFVSPEEAERVLAGLHIVDTEFRVADLQLEAGRIRNKTFERCVINGPALLAPASNVTMANVVIGVPGPPTPELLESALWEALQGKRLLGVVGVDNCVFSNCLFINIGFVGTKENLDVFRNYVGEEPRLPRPPPDPQ
jgi:hypothetical protein